MLRLETFLLLATVCRLATAGEVTSDNFNNGVIADSDSVSGFWTSNLSNGSGSANGLVEASGTLSMSVGDDDGTNDANYSGVLLRSAVSTSFNVFSNELVFQVRGLSFSGSTPASKQQFRFALNATSGSSYNSADAIVVRVRGDGTVLLGSKVDTANSSSDGTVTHESLDLGADNSATGFDFTLGPESATSLKYTLTVFGGSGATETGSISLSSADWDGAEGNASLMLWAQEFNATGGNEHYTVSVDSLTVSTVEPPAPPRTRYLPTSNYNVLFISIDDLKPRLGAYGDPVVKTPQMDAFSATAMRFTNAHCQQAICTASRTSVLTGVRPDTSKVWDLTAKFRNTIPNVVTLPQHFKNNGYTTSGIGKVFHGFSNSNQDVANSWSDGWNSSLSQFLYHEPQNATAEDAGDSMAAATDAGETDRGGNPVTDEHYPDGVRAASAITKLREYAPLYQNNGDTFFLAVGFYKPHLPFNCPKSYWDLYDPNAIDLSAYNGNNVMPTGTLPFTKPYGGEPASYSDIVGPTPTAAEARRLIHGYMACVSYVDAQVGKVLQELEDLGLASNTIVVIWGDHGWHLTDHGAFWSKHTNFEQATRSPLIIRAPGMNTLGSAGKDCQAPVELVDIYPTLVDICSLPAANQSNGLANEGTSLLPLLEDPAQPWKKGAFSQYQRYISGTGVSNPGNGMGYSVRTDRYRYTEWWRTQTSNQSNGVYSDRDVKLFSTPEHIELYDYLNDPGETVNLASDSQYTGLVAELSATLSGGNGWSTPGVSAPATYPSTYATWQAAHASPGISTATDLALNADPDGDLIPNRLEYKMGSHPLIADTGHFPSVIENDGSNDFLTLYFNTIPSREDVILYAEHSSTLQQGSFSQTDTQTDVQSTSASKNHTRARVLMTGDKNFMRLKVEDAE